MILTILILDIVFLAINTIYFIYTVKKILLHSAQAKSLLMFNYFVSGLTSHYRYLNGSVSLAVLTARPGI